MAISRNRRSKYLLPGIFVGSLATVALVGTMMASYSNKPMHPTLLFSGEHTVKEKAFINFLIKYDKAYASKDDINSKFTTFSENYDKIEKHNAEHEYFKQEINQFADLTEEEFAQIYLKGLKAPPTLKQTKPKLSAPEHPILNLPEHVDWNAAGVVTEPQN